MFEEKPVAGADFWRGIGHALVVVLPLYVVIFYLVWRWLEK